MLFEAATQQQAVASMVLESAFPSIKFLVKQEIFIRVSCHRAGNFWQLMYERTKSSPKTRERLLLQDN